MNEVGGIWNRLPILAFFFILAALGSAALPGLNGFVGEFPILVGMFGESRRAAVLGGTGMILGACYLLWMLRKVVFGPLREPADHEHTGGGSDHAAVRPIGWHEIAGLAPLMALIVLIGIVPGPFLDRIRPSVGEIDKNLQSQRGSMKSAVATPTIAGGTLSPRGMRSQHLGVAQSSPGKNVDEPSDRIRIGPADAPDPDPGAHPAGGGVAMMTASPFCRWPRRTWCALAAGALAAALLALLAVAGLQTDIYASVALNDSLGFYGRLVVLLSGLVLLALAHDEPADDTAGEFFGALLMINAGAMLVTTANELVFLFVGLELVSMPTYLLLYLTRRTATTQETATKYFYLSIFSSGLLLYGLAFLYGVIGVSNLKAMATISWSLPSIPHPQLGLIAVLFVLAGLSFPGRGRSLPLLCTRRLPGIAHGPGRPAVVGAQGGRVRRHGPGPHGGDLGERA